MNMSNNLYSLISYTLYGDFGLLTAVPYFLFRILLPIISSFYLLQAFFVESNLIKIVASKADRGLNKFGLSSSTLLSLFLGCGCVTVALGTLKDSDSKRHMRIAQILLCMIVPCSAQLVINSVLLFHVSRYYLILYTCIIFVLFFVLSLILNKLFPENKHYRGYIQGKDFRSLPRFAFPHIFPLLIHSIQGSFRFLKETTVPFAVGNILVSLLYFLGYIHKLCAMTAPIICGFLHLPPDAATVFILCIMKKDLAASSLLALFNAGKFSEPQFFVTAVMLTLFVPCFASMVVFFKQEKTSVCILVWLTCIVCSLFLGKILSCLFILPIAR